MQKGGPAPEICHFCPSQWALFPRPGRAPGPATQLPPTRVGSRPPRRPHRPPVTTGGPALPRASAGSGTREVRLRGALFPGQDLLPDGPERLRLRAAEGGGSILRTKGRVRTAQAWGAGPREGLRPRPACAYCACASRGRWLGLLVGVVRPSAPAVWTQNSAEKGG